MRLSCKLIIFEFERDHLLMTQENTLKQVNFIIIFCHFIILVLYTILILLISLILQYSRK